MAGVHPFLGLFYNQKIEPGKGLVPPYDVISETERKAFLKKDPHNYVRLLLGEGEDWYSKAADIFRKWRKDGTFVQDKEESFYVSEEEFICPNTGERKIRRGFFAVVDLEPIEKNIVRPHEKTHPGPKLDRLKLLKAIKAHVDPIFAMHDHNAIVKDILAKVVKTKPFREFKDYAGIKHKLWKLSDKKSCDAITDALKGKHLYIIDGHHRYETALTYAQRRHKEEGDNTLKPYDQVLMCLVCMGDPGLMCLPTHRLITKFPKPVEDVLRRIEILFDIKIITPGVPPPKSTIQFITKDKSYDVILRDPDQIFSCTGAGGKAPPFYHRLPVVLLHQVILEGLLGLDEVAQRHVIRYVKATPMTLAEATNQVKRGEFEALFILPQTTIEQVKEVGDIPDLFMPQKSTFFIPKILSGQVLYPFD